MAKYKVEALKTRLDKFLSEQLPATSRSSIQKDISDGLAVVNEKVAVEGKSIVRIGDVVEYKPRPEKEGLRAHNIPLNVLYDTHGLLIIDKPAGLAVHPGAGFSGNSLAAALLYRFEDIKLVGEEGRPGIVHRLDKDTSGVILVARTQDMYEYLKDAFAERKVKKEYIALVNGRVENPHGFIDTPIGKSKSDFRKYTTKNTVLSKDSLTEYAVLERLSSGLDEFTLCRVKLHTGRTHQIRVHFASIGHTLAGDTLYGKKQNLPKLLRQFLHAVRIEVRLPNGTWIEAESRLPEDLREVLKSLNSKKVSQL